MKNIIPNIRASLRLAGIVGLALTIVPLQTLVVGPVLRNHTFLPRTLMRNLRRLLGVQLNMEGAELEKKQKTIYVANHISNLDAIITGSKLNASFVAAAGVAKWPLIGQLGAAFKTIFIEQTRAGLPSAQKKLVDKLNGGTNIVLFPEGAMSDGSDVRQFKAGLLSLLYNKATAENPDVPVLSDKVVMQPIAMQVESVNGESVAMDPDKRFVFVREGDSTERQEKPLLSHVWNLMQQKNVTLKLTVLDPMDPADYDCHKAFVNAAHGKIRQIIAPENVINGVEVPMNKLDILKLQKQQAAAEAPSINTPSN